MVLTLLGPLSTDTLSHYDSVVMADTNRGEDGVLNAGDTIEYTMNVTNTGNTCLVGVLVTNDGIGSIECDAWYPGKLGVSLPVVVCVV